MAVLAPPPKPPTLVATGDDDRLHRLQFRLWQVMLTIITVAATIYICMLGIPLLAIISVGVAKHVLVAILIMGMEKFSLPQGP